MKVDLKIAVLLGDGMADYPLDELGGRTPLEVAETPHMDSLARKGILGMVKTVPDGMAPGSDTANLSIFGYDPVSSYTGRAPLEALNMGISMGPDDVAFRCNTVTITDGIMKDFSADHIDSEFTRVVIEEAARGISIPGIEFHPGVSYRNIIIWRNYPFSEVTTTVPPHDIQDQGVEQHMPSGAGNEVLRRITAESTDIIMSSPRIREASSMYRGKPTTLWMWGGGRRPAVQTMKALYGLEGYTISAVDLIHGIGRAAGLEPVHVPGATGYIDTNYEGKARALLDAMDRCNFVYLHVESPDESGHEGNLTHKIKSIEDFDAKVVGPVMKGMSRYDDYCILLLPDHPTPLSIRTHASDPVPFVAYRSRGWADELPGKSSGAAFSEKEGLSTGIYIPDGHKLISYILNGKIGGEK